MRTGELPASGGQDPFTYTAPVPLSADELRSLRSQWLGQAALYIVIEALGPAGFSALRAVLIVLPFAFVYALYAAQGKAHPVLAASLLAFPPLFIAHHMFYTFERPQVASFYLALAVYGLLGPLREGRGRWWPGIGLVFSMGLWGNLHAGYLVGVAVIGAYAAGVGIALAASRLGFGERMGGACSAPVRFYASCAAAIAAVGLNPAGYQLLQGWMGTLRGMLMSASGGGPASAGSVVLREVLEYKSIGFFYTEFHYAWPLYLGAFYAFGISMLIVKYVTERRAFMPEALVAVFVAALGTYYARGITFALLFMPLFIVRSAASLRGTASKAVAAAIACLLTAFLLSDIARTTPWELVPGVPRDWVDSSYPEGAAAFIEEHSIPGPLFNDLRWGGYLIYRLHPAYRVFIDGRMVSGDATSLYLDVVSGRPSGRDALETYGINILLVPVVSRENGTMSPLVRMVSSEEPRVWAPVYLEDNVALFVRDAEANRETIDCCRIPREMIYVEAAGAADGLLHLIPGHPEALLTKALAMYELKQYDEAGRLLNLIPKDSPLKRELLGKLRK